MQRIEQSPLGSNLVSLSVATSLVDDVPKIIKVKLEAVETLLPSAKDYVEDNDMLPEIVSIAGLDETTEFSAITETSQSVLNGHYLYTLSMTIQDS